MILYKYASFSAARSIIEGNSIGFTCLEDLNDPFECTAFGFSKNPKEEVPPRVSYGAYKNWFSRKYAMLSLSRRPLNNLMWAHYGDSYQGIVIGIDVEKAGLTSTDTSVIPAQHGNIKYIEEKDSSLGAVPSAEELMTIGSDSIAYGPEDFNLLKRAFLFKSAEWEYEKEVRVVKNITSSPMGFHSGEGPWKDKTGHWNKIMKGGKPLYCYQLPKKSIAEVILGSQAYRNVSRSNQLTDKEYRKLIIKWKKKMKVSVSEADVLSWGLKSRPHEFPI